MKKNFKLSNPDFQSFVSITKMLKFEKNFILMLSELLGCNKTLDFGLKAQKSTHRKNFD